ncbi:uncharacterized protein LOC144886340 [Branchiostoma floridae x Branchiostoma japonicum]
MRQRSRKPLAFTERRCTAVKIQVEEIHLGTASSTPRRSRVPHLYPTSMKVTVRKVGKVHTKNTCRKAAGPDGEVTWKGQNNNLLLRSSPYMSKGNKEEKQSRCTS